MKIEELTNEILNEKIISLTKEGKKELRDSYKLIKDAIAKKTEEKTALLLKKNKDLTAKKLSESDKTLNNDEKIQVIKKELKQTHEQLEAEKSSGRNKEEVISKCLTMIKLIEELLPQEASKEEVLLFLEKLESEIKTASNAGKYIGMCKKHFNNLVDVSTIQEAFSELKNR